MNIVLGIDTGGTYTDAVLLDQSKTRVLAKAKSPTTKNNLDEGIQASIQKLNIADPSVIQKVVLSTTLATNAIVEGEGRPTGLVIIGAPPKGPLPTNHVVQIQGKVNIKGREVTPLDPNEIQTACETLVSHVQAIAVSGMMSTRNAKQELTVKKAFQKRFDLPVVCGHELSSQLGFHDRTVTTILNASLIPIIVDFIAAVKKSLATVSITAPVFIVKGDGNLASLDFIREKPIETILSGPAASIIGALSLAGLSDGIVVDMGGTTTDSGIIQNNTLTLSPVGAQVGKWQTQIDSADLNTFGLGGDTQIIPEGNHPVLTEKRGLPACRGGNALTPTDLLHCSGELNLWDTTASKTLLKTQADQSQTTPSHYASTAETLILETIRAKVLERYNAPEIPIIAIGAPAKAWYEKVQAQNAHHVVIPEHYEVANAVGAAMAAVEERVDALVHPDEANDGFVAHAGGESCFFSDKQAAVDYAVKQAKALSLAAARRQGADQVTVQVHCQDIVKKINWKDHYIKTKIRAVAKANNVLLIEDPDRPE